jgi:hypothetical protein
MNDGLAGLQQLTGPDRDIMLGVLDTLRSSSLTVDQQRIKLTQMITELELLRHSLLMNPQLPCRTPVSITVSCLSSLFDYVWLSLTWL